MLGGRALLAFAELAAGSEDVDEDDAELGAIMMAEHQAHARDLLKLMSSWAKAWVRAHRKR